jgi:hypothetical protein
VAQLKSLLAQVAPVVLRPQLVRAQLEARDLDLISQQLLPVAAVLVAATTLLV